MKKVTVGLDDVVNLIAINSVGFKIDNFGIRFPDEYGLDNYRFDVNGVVSKILKNNIVSELRMDNTNKFNVTTNGGKHKKINYDELQDIIKRYNGEFKTRRRLIVPYERYEIDRVGNLYLYKKPTNMLQRCKNGSNLFRLYDGRYISAVELVTRYYVCGFNDYVRDFNNGVFVSTIPVNVQLTNRRVISENDFKPSRNNSNIISWKFKELNFTPISIKDDIYYNIDTGDLYEGFNGEKLNPINVNGIHIYTKHTFNFKSNSVLKRRFKLNFIHGKYIEIIYIE